jgi:hypothetical protein
MHALEGMEQPLLQSGPGELFCGNASTRVLRARVMAMIKDFMIKVDVVFGLIIVESFELSD